MTKNVISTVIVVFMVMAVTSVTIALPVSAQTVSVEILKAWPRWRRLIPSEHPYQILYAKARNTGTEAVFIKVKFFVTWVEGIDTYEFWTEELELLPHPQPIKLETTIFVPVNPGDYLLNAQLYYKYGADWVLDGVIRNVKVAFTVAL